MNDIEVLRERTIKELIKIYEFKTHTEMAYRQFQKCASDSFHTVNFITHTSYNKQNLLPRYEQYSLDYLTSLSFQHTVNIFEAFLFDLLDLLSPGDSKLKQLKHKNVADWIAYLNKILKCASAKPEEIQHIVEIRASRDILVHTSGVVNATYVSKSAQMARYAEGEQLEITQKYFHETWELTKKIVQNICDAAMSKR